MTDEQDRHAASLAAFVRTGEFRMKLAVDIRQRWLADSLTIATTNAVPAKMESSVVIPGRAQGASPESILTGGRYGFRAPSLRAGPGN
jgi:hypothetical protein